MELSLPPDDARLNALVAGAADGVACDGLHVLHETDGYVFETPEVRTRGLSEEDLRGFATDWSQYVTNWYLWEHTVPTGAEQAFLRWLERAEELAVPERYQRLETGLDRKWGELRLTATVTSEGSREYHLRHRADQDQPRDALEQLEDSSAVRELVRFDERGRYRPLKSAPTLRNGWVVAALDPADLVRAVELFYPVSVHNWYRERRGNLDVTHWRAAAARQSGIYEVVSTLPDEAVPWLASACCVDEACLKRRAWDLDGDTPLDVPRGDGAFPCREPCSLAIAVAREVTLDEEAEGDPGESVDPIDEERMRRVREGDVVDPANPYRVRYRQAKHGTDPLAVDDDPPSMGGAHTAIRDADNHPDATDGPERDR